MRIEREGSISFENSAPLASVTGAMPGKTEAALLLHAIASVTISQTNVACPSEARISAAGGTEGIEGRLVSGHYRVILARIVPRFRVGP